VKSSEELGIQMQAGNCNRGVTHVHGAFSL
jgi:hypothetical protein